MSVCSRITNIINSDIRPYFFYEKRGGARAFLPQAQQAWNGFSDLGRYDDSLAIIKEKLNKYDSSKVSHKNAYSQIISNS